MSIAYASHMMDTFYNPIYFFVDLVSYIEISITIEFLYEAKLTNEVLFNFRIVCIFSFV